MPKGSARRHLATLVLLAAVVWGGTSLTPPPLVEPTSPADFDGHAAWKTLEEIAHEPHSLGTAAHERTREALVARLRANGFEPEVQEAVGIYPSPVTAGTVRNVLARLDPPSPRAPHARDAILLVCHYDSRTAAVGAGDDAAGTAALVEALRALKAGPPLIHPVILLITDGEEKGLMGAEAFISQHRWAGEVAVVLNFESRGASGPALLFETSPDCGRLVRAFGASAPRPTGTSLAGAVYRTMPNDTDLSVFLDAGYTGLNFAFNQGWTHYHTLLDDPAHLDPRSMAHHGRTALELVRRLCADPALPAAAPDPIYFNLMPGVFVLYGSAFAYALAAYLLLCTLLAWIAYFRSEHASASALARALAAGTIGIVAAGALAVGLATSASAWHHQILGVGDSLRSGWYFAAMFLGGWGVVTGALAIFGAEGAAAGPAAAVSALTLWTLLATASAWFFAPGSYLFAWPPLMALLFIQRAVRGSPAPDAAWYDLLQRGVVPIPAATLLASTIVLFFESLGNSVTGSIAAGALAGLATLLAIPLLELEDPSRCRAAALAGLVLAALCVGAGAFLTRPTADHPDHCWLAYGLDVREHRALWVGAPQAPDPWSRRALGDAPVIAPLPNLLVTRPDEPVAHAPARLLDLPPPAIAVLSDRAMSDQRRLRLRVTSPRAASLFWLSFPADRLIEVRMDGRVLPPPGLRPPQRRHGRRAPSTATWTLDAAGVPPAGFVLELAVRGAAPLPVRICDFAIGLPPDLARELGPMPETVTPFDVGLCTVVAQSLAL